MNYQSVNVSEFLRRARALREQAYTIRSRAAAQTFPRLDTDIAVAASMLAAAAMEGLGAIQERISAVASGQVKAIAADLMPGLSGLGEEVLAGAIVASQEILLHSAVDQLNKAEFMLDGTMTVRGQAINRGDLWDK